MITKFYVRNFGPLKDLSVDLDPFTVLVGPNDAGKSMIMRALQVWGKAASKGDNWNMDVLRRVSWKGRQEEMLFGADIRFGEENLACVEFVNVRDGVVRLRAEEHAVSPNKPRWHFLLAGLEQVPKLGDRSLGFLGRIRRYMLRPERMVSRRLCADSGSSPLDPESLCLPEVWADLLLANDGAAKQIERALIDMFPFVAGLHVQRKANSHGPDEYSLSFRLKSEGGLVPASLSSDGLRAMLAHLTLLLGDEKPSLLMIEEPESGLHPALVGKLVELFESASKGSDHRPPIQVLVSTQSPDFLNFVSEKNIRVVWRDDDSGETKVERFEEAPKLSELLRYQGPGEIWANMGEEYLIGAAK